MWDHFRRGLHDLGYIEGRNVTIEYRSAEGRPDRLATAATELARLPVDVFVTFGTPATHAAKQVTATIPIVMTAVGDAVRAGLVTSLAHPGENITGNSILGPEVGGKRLQLLKLAVPTMSRAAFLWNPNNASHAAYLDELKAVAPALGVEMLLVAVRSPDEFDGAFAAMMRERPDAFTMTADPLHLLRIGWIIDFLARNRLAGHVPGQGKRGCWGAHVIRRELARFVPTRCRLRAQDFARHAARRPARGAADQVRPDCQPQDCESTWAHDPGIVPSARRRGD
jgi:putative ABC transport system substrate-binding protein